MIQPTSQEFTREFSHLSKQALIIILEDSMKQVQSLKVQYLMVQEQLYDAEEHLEILKKKESSSKDSHMMMMYTQQRNVDKLESLERAVNSFGNRYQQNIPMQKKDNQWEWKYKQLKRHLELYITSANNVQQQLLEGCKKAKKQKARIYQQYQKQTYYLQEIRAKCRGLEATLMQREDQIIELKQKQFRSLQKSRINQRQNEIQNKIMKQATDRYCKLQQQVKSLEFRYSGLTKQRDILSVQINDLHQLNQQFKHQNRLLKQTISKLQTHNKALLDRLIDPVPVSQSITQRNLIQTWSIQVKRLKRQLQDLDQKYSSMKQLNKSLQQQKIIIAQKLKIIQNSNQQLLKQNLMLSSEVRLMSNKNPSKYDKQKQNETDGDSTIMASVQMNWLDCGSRKIKNFLSQGVKN